MAEFKLGRIKFVYQGAWANGTSYVVDDVVTVSGKTYICVVTHTASSLFATDLSAVPTKWNLVSDGSKWTGSWQTSTYYNAGDIALYGGIVYICKTPHTSAATTTLGLENDQSKWDAFAASFNWTGSWSPNTRYKVRDFVSYGGYTYVCNTYHTSAATSALGLEADSSKWDTFNAGINYKGAWSGSSYRYKVNDIVTYGADLWICTTYHTSTGTTIDQTKFSIFVNGFEFLNSWNSSTNYVIGDIVTYGGYTYTAIQNGSNQTPSTATAYWQPFTTGFTFQGDWVSSTAYKVGSVVRLGGYTYLATTDNTGQTPPNTSYWQQLNSGLRWTPAVQNFSAISGTNISSSGLGAKFDITVSGTTYGVVINSSNKGSGYAVNDTIKVLGTSVGGLSPANDITLTVTGQTAGAINTVSVSGISVTWVTGSLYLQGDVVFYGASSYVCIQAHAASSGNSPSADSTGTYWNLLASGTEQAVLTTQGDMFYYGSNGPTRLPIGSDGQILRVNNNTPTWQYYGQVNNVVYVAPSGSDVTTAGQGTTIDKPWQSIRYACQQVEDGYLNTNAKMLLRINKQFMIKEVNNYVLNQYTFNVTGTASGTNQITVGGSSAYQTTTGNMFAGMPISFTSTAGGITAGTTYYVLAVVDSTHFTITATANGVSSVTLSTTGTSNSGTYVYSQSKTERDAGLVVEGITFDISHNGNYKTYTNTKAFFSTDGQSLVSGVSSYDIAPFNKALGYLSNTLVPNVLANTAPATIYQVVNGVASGSRALQQINTSYTAESTAVTNAQTLISLVTTTLAQGNTNQLGLVINPNTTISIKTGTYNEILPVIVPAYTALVGDELRSTVVQPFAADPQLATVVPKTQAVLTRIQSLIPNLISNTTITPSAGNTVSQVTGLPAGSTGSYSTALPALNNSFYHLYRIVANGTNAEPPIVMPKPSGWGSSLTDTAYGTTTGASNAAGATTGYDNAVTLIQNNYPFIVAELLAYLSTNYNTLYTGLGTSGPGKGSRDLYYILDSVVYDLIYGGNYQSNIAGGSFYSLYILQVTAAEQTAFVATLGRLKTIISQIAQKTSVTPTSGNNLTQYTGGTAGSAAAAGFAQDRVQNVVNYLNNGVADASISPALAWPAAALQTSYSNLVAKQSEIASDATAWCSKYYQSVYFSTVLANRDAGLIIQGAAYDMLFGSNFNAIQAGRAFCRANTSAITLRSGTELAPTLGAINFMSYKAKNIAAGGAAAQIQTTIDDINNYIDGGSEPFATTMPHPSLPQATYSTVSGSNITGTGTSATFNITRYSNGNGYWTFNVAIAAGGSGYSVGNTIKILGTSIGGATPTNDIQLNVTQVNAGAIVAVTFSATHYAVAMIEANRSFLLAEVIAYINANYASITSNPLYTVTKTQRDLGYIIDAVKYDLLYGGNWQSQEAGMAYYSALYGTQIASALSAAFTNSVNYISTIISSVVTGATIGSPLQATVTQITQLPEGVVGSAANGTQAAALFTVVKNFITSGLTSGAPTVAITTIASGTTFTTNTSHGLSLNDIIIPQTTANGLVSTVVGSGTVYYVNSVPSGTTFTLSASYGGAQLTSFTNGTGLNIVIQTVNMPYLGWVGTNNTAALTAVSGALSTYQTQVVTYLNTNYSALTYNSTYAQRDTYKVTLAAMMDTVLGSNFASIVAGRAYNRTQDYQLQGYEKTATIASLNYLVTLISSTLSGYSTQQTAAQTAAYLTIAIAQNGSGQQPQMNGTVTYNNDLGIIKGAEILRANIPFLAQEAVSWYNANYGGTVSSTAITTNLITTSGNHNLSVNDPVIFTGSTAGGLTASTVANPVVYYVASVPSNTTFTVTTGEGYLNTNTGSNYPTVSLSTTSSPGLSVVYYFNVAGCKSDITYFLNAIVYDLQYTGNYKSLLATQVLLNSVNGSAGSDMWHVRNGTGVRNMTMNGLTGTLTNANTYGTKRITGGSYTSLDPGFGPNDSNSWIYNRSCYTQNCTMFGYAVAGAKVDGALHAGGYRSMVANDYTCIIGDGIGYWVTGSNALAELVSVFNYYGYAGYLAELGARIRATNGNSSYGTYGVLAEGVDTYETPIYGNLNNRAFGSQITNVVTDGTNQVLRFEYSTAGQNYTNAVPTISGSGYNAAVSQDEFRDAAVFETRLIDTGTTSNPSVGGTSYVTSANVAQGGAIGYITIAATDIALNNAYNGMRMQITAGTGVGQYADVIGYSNGTKVALVTRPTFNTLQITSASSTNNLLTVASTASLYTGMPIYVGTTYAGLTAGTVYYVIAANFSATQFAVSTSSGGSAASITTTAGSTVTVTATSAITNTITATNTLSAGQVITFNSSFNGIDSGTLYYVLSGNLSSSGFSVSTSFNGPAVTITTTGVASSTGTVGIAVYGAGWDHVVPGTTIVNNLDLTTGYIIEPKITYSAPGYTATARTLPGASATWTSVAYGAGNYVAVASGGTRTAYSTNGTSWTSGGALPSSTTWASVVYGGGQLATATANVGGFGGAGAVLQAVIGTGSSATQIVSITVVNGGYNYTTPPTIVITGGGGSGATAICTVLNGAIQSVTMSINGSGYTSTPTITVSTSAISTITVNTWGKNYYSTPTVTVAQPQGLSPTAFALNTSVSLNAYLQTAAGRIYQVTQAGTTDAAVTPTFDYTSNSYTNITNGTAKLTYIATQAQATANMTNAGVSSITVNTVGYGYTTVPTVTILDTAAKFVAISSATTAVGYATVSGLGSAWSSTVSNASTNQNLQSLAYGGGYYIAVGGASGTGTAASSSDGVTWIARTPTALSSSAYYSSVAYGAGYFVAVANGLTTTTVSANSGATWSAGGTLPASFTSAVSIAFGNNRFVVLGSDGKLAYSINNGTTWTAVANSTGTTTSILSSSYTWSSVAYYQGHFMAIAKGTTVCATSWDGINWTVQAMPSSSNWQSLVGGSPISATLGAQPLWVAVSNTSGSVSASIRQGATTRGRMKVTQASGIVNEIRLIEPGGGYPKGNVSATTTSTNLITVDDTTNLRTSTANNQPITFTGLDAYGLTTNTVYYVVGSSVTSTQFSVTATAGSTTTVGLTTGTPTGTYRAGPVVTQIDPNRVTLAGTTVRMADGVLGNPTFTNRGTNNATATASVTGDGFADIYQNSAYINVSGLFSIPQAGANVQFASITGNSQWYKLVTVTNILGIAGNYTAQFTINPSLTTLLAPVNGTLVTTRLKYSQVRLTGHDFLYIGTGNQTQTNYPNVDASKAIQANQQYQTGGGRVFFTSTDQDGNFNVGNLFGVQQSTGTATLNASAFNLAGLQSLTLGAINLGVGSATITQFSTDPYFTANSDSILPTQKAIKSFITAQIGGGSSSLNVNTLTSGQVYIANNTISNTTGNQIYVSSKMLFTGGIDGSPVALVFFGQR